VGSIVIGTVRGDIHDIGKNIFKMLAEVAGFSVHDLGVDVDPQVFVQEIKAVNANILGLSALLTTTIPEMGNVVRALHTAGARDKVKIVLGGNAVTREFAVKIGADYAAVDAVDGMEVCRKWIRR
jgi:methanogenic corrinoid protein MtbC1